ncbi:MAG: glutathione S-transferase family protein [Hyphomicrobiales bacterium]
MFKLYARRGAGSMAVEAVLAECAVPYQVEDLERGPDGKFPASFYRINPLGQVPTLILPDDSVMTESAAMLIYLADLHPDTGLAPPVSSPLRARYLRWLVCLATTVYMSDLRYYHPQLYTSDPAGAEAVKGAALGDMAREFDIFAEALGEGPYVLGETFSAVDIYAAMLASWNADVPAFFARHPNIKALHDRVTSRPRIAKVWERNEA